VRRKVLVRKSGFQSFDDIACITLKIGKHNYVCYETNIRPAIQSNSTQ